MDNILETHIQNQVLIKPNSLKDEITLNNILFNQRQEYYNLIKYIDEFLEGKNTNRYFVLPGIRGVGKSTIIFQIYDYLLNEKNINANNILYLSCDNLKKICNASLIEGVNCYLDIFHNAILETVKEPIFLLIDESQIDVDWSIIGKIIFDTNKNIFMIFTGSSALELTYNADSARRLLKIPIMPLSYPEQLKLKYGKFNTEMFNSINELIYNGNIEKAKGLESQLLKIYSEFENYNINEWENFLKFGGFPSNFNQKQHEIINKLIDTVNKIVTNDMKNINGLNGKTQDLAFNLLYFFALQNPGEVSKGSMANIFDSNKSTINKLLDTLEKTQLIFHVEPFTSSAKRTTKPNKYYFATSSLKHVLSLAIGNASLENKQAYMGKLFENFVASTFFNFEKINNNIHKTYYDSGKKQDKNVDFIIQKGFEKPIPIEVSYGRKDKSQIKNAIRRYKANHGIIISNTTKIKKEDNVIYLPRELFSFL